MPYPKYHAVNAIACQHTSISLLASGLQAMRRSFVIITTEICEHGSKKLTVHTTSVRFSLEDALEQQTTKIRQSSREPSS